MKQRYSIAFLAVLLPGLLAGEVHAGTLYVANNGNDQNPGTSLEMPLRTLAGAVRVVQPGDIIELRAGSYTGATITAPGNGAAGSRCALMVRSE